MLDEDETCWEEAHFQAAIHAQREGRVRDRLRAVMLLRLTPLSSAQVGERLGLGRDFAWRWSRRFAKGGVAALGDLPRPGQTKRLPAEREEAFLGRLDAAPAETDGISAWRGEDIRRLLADEFGAHYSLSGTYALLHRLGRSHLAPRPRHPDAPPPEEVEAFTSTAAPLFSPRRPPPTPASVSSSASRTRAAMARKG